MRLPDLPQTHIVEGLSDRVRAASLAPCEYISVESEFAAMSVAIGASASGARAYTATSSQGLVHGRGCYNASGLGLPIVMTVQPGDRLPDQHLERPQRHDVAAGLRLIQLYAETNQALDLHVQAYKLAEAVLPVMVCMDGFILTHAYERVDLPGQEEVDAFLPSYEPRQVLDPSDPVTIGALVGPEAFFEVKYLMHAKQMQALDLIPELAADFEEAFGRDSGGLLSTAYGGRGHGIVALGSVLGTIRRP